MKSSDSLNGACPNQTWSSRSLMRALNHTLLLVLILYGTAVAQVPDLSGLDADTRMSIQFACGSAKAEGPAPYRNCIWRQLESIGGTGYMADLSEPETDVRQSEGGDFADDVWELGIEGTGTPFEKRWATANPITNASSAESELAFAGISVHEGDLELFIGDPFSAAEVLLSAMAGEELECAFDNWRLAVDRQEVRIADTSRSTDNSATFLQPQDTTEFWQAFAGGSRLAVQVERTCYGDMNVVTMVYSLAGSQAALQFVSN